MLYSMICTFIINMFEIIFYGVKLTFWRGGITYVLEVSCISESTNSIEKHSITDTYLNIFLVYSYLHSMYSYLHSRWSLSCFSDPS